MWSSIQNSGPRSHYELREMLDDSEPRLPKTACCKKFVSNQSLAATMPQIYKLTIQNMTWYHTEYISWYVIPKGIF